MRKKRTDTPEAGFAPQGARPHLTPIDIQQKEFRLAFRGYNERDVDEFLDHVTEDLAALVEENGRLREGDGFVGTAAPFSETVAASRDAEDILARAREQAQAIIQEAQERAAAIVASGAGGDARALISPYLSQERAFLQTLGELVKEHAEAVKGMVRSAKDSAPAASPPRTPPAPVADVPVATERSQVIRIDPADAGRPAEPAGPEESSGGEFQAGAAPEGRSVRELFWGED